MLEARVYNKSIMVTLAVAIYFTYNYYNYSDLFLFIVNYKDCNEFALLQDHS